MKMLIGPTFTLNKFEEILNDRLLQNKKRNQDANKKYEAIRSQLTVIPRMIEDEKSDQLLANPAYLKLVTDGQEVQTELEEISEQNEFINARIEELETIEERSRGAVDKDKEKITLTLKDCLDFGIELGE